MPKFRILGLLLSSATGGSVVSSTDWSSVLDALSAQISVSTIIPVIAATITAGIGMVFMWWGVRKLVRSVMCAFRTGRLKV